MRYLWEYLLWFNLEDFGDALALALGSNQEGFERSNSQGWQAPAYQ